MERRGERKEEGREERGGQRREERVDGRIIIIRRLGRNDSLRIVHI